jgi:hypothetical protein
MPEGVQTVLRLRLRFFATRVALQLHNVGAHYDAAEAAQHVFVMLNAAGRTRESDSARRLRASKFPLLGRDGDLRRERDFALAGFRLRCPDVIEAVGPLPNVQLARLKVDVAPPESLPLHKVRMETSRFEAGLQQRTSFALRRRVDDAACVGRPKNSFSLRHRVGRRYAVPEVAAHLKTGRKLRVRRRERLSLDAFRPIGRRECRPIFIQFLAGVLFGIEAAIQALTSVFS